MAIDLEMNVKPKISRSAIAKLEEASSAIVAAGWAFQRAADKLRELADELESDDDEPKPAG